MATSIEERNMELMQTLDDAWNTQDWDTFDQRHKPDVVVRWPGQPPTNGTHDHRAEAIEMFKTFPDNQVGNQINGVPIGAITNPGLYSVPFTSTAFYAGGARPPEAHRDR